MATLTSFRLGIQVLVKLSMEVLASFAEPFEPSLIIWAGRLYIFKTHQGAVLQIVSAGPRS